MSIRFWIVGGEYDGPEFRALIPGSETMVGPFEDERKARNEWMRLTYSPGTEVIHGPYADELKARMEWQRLTFKDRHEATERYSICVEPVLL